MAPHEGEATLADLSAAEKRRVARLVEQLLAVEKAHETAQTQWRAAEADLKARADAADRSAAVAHKEHAAAVVALDAATSETSDLRARALGAESALRVKNEDLGATRAELQDALRKTDHADRRARDLEQANRELVDESTVMQEKLMASLKLLEQYQEQILRMTAASPNSREAPNARDPR